MSNAEQTKTAKQSFQETMVDILERLEDMEIPEGAYLEIANAFQKMNVNLDELLALRRTYIDNVYYQTFVRRETRRTLSQKRLTEGEKARHPDYYPCSCGRHIKKCYEKNHLETLVHAQGIRNRKVSKECGKNAIESEEEINQVLREEVIEDTEELVQEAIELRRQEQEEAEQRRIEREQAEQAEVVEDEEIFI